MVNILKKLVSWLYFRLIEFSPGGGKLQREIGDVPHLPNDDEHRRVDLRFATSSKWCFRCWPDNRKINFTIRSNRLLLFQHYNRIITFKSWTSLTSSMFSWDRRVLWLVISTMVRLSSSILTLSSETWISNFSTVLIDNTFSLVTVSNWERSS